nr:MAG TPA: Adipokinetic hormone [Herelleviridae sp.]DAO07051.1 MAG TPA: Adipokinetic hormone [Caudoviricetes sp.]
MPREFISLTGEKYFPNWGKRKTLYGGCMNRKI